MNSYQPNGTQLIEQSWFFYLTCMYDNFSNENNAEPNKDKDVFWRLAYLLNQSDKGSIESQREAHFIG